MDILIIILIVLVVIMCSLFVIYMLSFNKLQDYIIRINEVEASIDTSLRNKYDNLNKCITIIKNKDENVKVDSFEEIIKLRSRKISNFDLERKLVKCYHDLIIYRNDNKEILENEDIESNILDIDNLDDRIDIEIDYYNKKITEYNKLITKFPTRIIAKINKYKEKLYFDRKDMSDEDYNDFKL